MHITSYSMPYKFTDNTVTVLLAMRLNRIAYITDAFAVNSLFYTFIE